MKITIIRSDIGAEVTMGKLYMNSKLLCDTLERTPVMLPKGIYLLSLKKMYITHGNGAYRLRGPDIIVGDYRCHGLLIHSRVTSDRLFNSIYKCLKAGRTVILEIAPL